MTVPNSLVVMVPSPSLSKSENASLNSADRKWIEKIKEINCQIYLKNTNHQKESLVNLLAPDYTDK